MKGSNKKCTIAFIHINGNGGDNGKEGKGEDIDDDGHDDDGDIIIHRHLTWIFALQLVAVPGKDMIDAIDTSSRHIVNNNLLG